MNNELTITHDYEDGTVVHGTMKNSSAHRALKAHTSWTWSRYVDAWILRSSRQRRAKHAKIDQMAEVLRGEGYEVTVEVDEAMPDMATREQDLEQRMDDRADALRSKTHRQYQDAAEWQYKSDSVPLPPMGEPIKVGHHSEGRHRRALERAHNYMGKAVRGREQAARTAGRAESAEHHMGARYSPVTVVNRIEKFEKQERDLLKDWEGRKQWIMPHDGSPTYFGRAVPTEHARAHIEDELAEVRSQLEWWRQVRADHIASGKALDLGPHNVAKGDWIRVRRQWLPVRRVNKKSVTVPNPVQSFQAEDSDEMTMTQPWHKIDGHRKAEDVPAEVVEEFENRLKPLQTRES